MTQKNISKAEQLAVFIRQLERAAEYLEESFLICEPFVTSTTSSRSELREYEALTARFARLSDLLVQKVLRYIGTVESSEAGSIIDIMHRAEKQAIASSAAGLSEIRELRNEIAHEYATRDIEEVAADVVRWTPVLIAMTERAIEYAQELTARLP